MTRTPKTTQEKIQDKEKQIEKLRERIKKDNERIKKLEKEKESLINSEIQGAIKEIDMPLHEVLGLLKELKHEKKEGESS